MASVKKPWKRFINRDTVQGREGGDRRSRSRSFAALFSRLRRVEVILLHLSGRLKMQPEEVDNLLERVLELSEVVEPSVSGGGADQGDAVLLSYEDATGGET